MESNKFFVNFHQKDVLGVEFTACYGEQMPDVIYCDAYRSYAAHAQ